MIFNDSYFKDEVRDGFFVPSEMKRAWAAELEVLSEIDKICKKHKIQYFADWGTLLAAVRHEGFIPWDDDLDIVMKRQDYKRFMKIAQMELPEGFSAYNFRNHDDLWLFLGRVVGKRRICFEEEHLERFHQFPYIAGVDIFVLDYISRDEEAEKKRNNLAFRTIAFADMIGNGTVLPTVKEQELCRIERECGVRIARNLSNLELRRELYCVVELLFERFGEEESDELTQLFPFGLRENAFRMDKKCYEAAIELPYENTRIPVPIRYCEMLTKKYHGYMQLVHDSGAHEYPFFEAQKKKLQAVLDFDMPQYRFSKEQLTCERDYSGYKSCCKQMIEQLDTQITGMQKMLDSRTSVMLNDNMDEMLTTLQTMQQIAIEMGTMIEEVKGEGTETVNGLEAFCEMIYESSILLKQKQDVLTKITVLQEQLEEIKNSLQTEILNRKEVVFVVSEAAHLKYIGWYLKKEMQKSDTDIFIVAVPYDYKKYDGRCYASCYEFDKINAAAAQLFFDDIKNNDGNQYQIAESQQFDIQMHHPDKIVIQNPCDEWNQAITLPEEYYSCNLQKYTETLVYIPSFELKEFTEHDNKEYYNMQYYCTMPGVVRADKVYVQSEYMRKIYVKKLTEFAGRDTKEIWEKKIAIAEKLECNDKIHPDIHNAGQRKKKISFYVQVGLTVQYGEQILKKLESVVQTFQDSKEMTEFFWIYDKEHDDFLRKYDETLAERYNTIRNRFVSESWGLCIERQDMSVAEIVEMSDAYYGSESHIALQFLLKRKPVLIMNPEIM